MTQAATHLSAPLKERDSVQSVANRQGINIELSTRFWEGFNDDLSQSSVVCSQTPRSLKKQNLKWLRTPNLYNMFRDVLEKKL